MKSIERVYTLEGSENYNRMSVTMTWYPAYRQYRLTVKPQKQEIHTSDEYGTYTITSFDVFGPSYFAIVSELPQNKRNSKKAFEAAWKEATDAYYMGRVKELACSIGGTLSETYTESTD